MCPSKAANSRVSRSACLRCCCSRSCWCCKQWRVRFHRHPFFVESVEFGLDSISPAALDPVLLRVWRYYRCVAPGPCTVPETPCPPRSTSVSRRVRVHPIIIYLIPLASIVAVSPHRLFLTFKDLGNGRHIPTLCVQTHHVRAVFDMLRHVERNS